MKRRCRIAGPVARVTVVCALALVPMWVSAGGGGALTMAERTLLQDPQAARQEILRRVQNAEAAVASMAEDPAGRRRVTTLQRELGKVQQALDVEDYKAAYLFARRVEDWATAGPRIGQ